MLHHSLRQNALTRGPKAATPGEARRGAMEQDHNRSSRDSMPISRTSSGTSTNNPSMSPRQRIAPRGPTRSGRETAPIPLGPRRSVQKRDSHVRLYTNVAFHGWLMPVRLARDYTARPSRVPYDGSQVPADFRADHSHTSAAISRRKPSCPNGGSDRRADSIRLFMGEPAFDECQRERFLDLVLGSRFEDLPRQFIGG